MPIRNVKKNDIPDTLYHVYGRGHNKMVIFREDEDYRVFLNLLKRHLSAKDSVNSRGVIYENLFGKIELICYCLMPNHFHLLVYQNEINSMSRLMHNVKASYSRYFNKKYKTQGTLFETTYKASVIDNDSYFLHISRYIHLNPDDWLNYKYSSISYYLYRQPPVWLRTEKVMDLFKSRDEYEEFLSDRKDYQSSFEHISNDMDEL